MRFNKNIPPASISREAEVRYEIGIPTISDMKAFTALQDSYVSLGIEHNNFHRALHASFLAHRIRISVILYKHCGVKMKVMTTK
ncbi:MAG: hypothetical protein AABY15_02795 [Nanoarchaeota archaeon]